MTNARPRLEQAPARTRTEVPVTRSTGQADVRFLVVFLLVLGTQAGGVFALNVVANPRSEFGGHVFPPLARDEAHEKVALYEALPEPPATLVVGSSRSMKVAPADLAQAGFGPAFNFAISGGSTGDPLAIYRYAAAQGTPPRVLLYGIEVDQLQAERLTRWQVRVSPELGPHAPEPAGLADRGERLLSSFSPGYVTDSLKVLKYAATGYPPLFDGFEADGRLRYHVWESQVAAGTYDLDRVVDAQMPDVKAVYARQGPPDASRLEVLRTLLDEAAAHGTEVRLFLTPYEPRTLDALEAQGFQAQREATVEALRGLCREGVHVHDFTEVESFGGDPRGFYDGWHYDDANARLLVGALMRGEGDACAAS